MTPDERARRLHGLETLGITEVSVRRTAEKFRARYPWRGDWFTLDQVECLLLTLDMERVVHGCFQAPKDPAK